MTLYLTNSTPPEEIVRAKESGKIFAVKLYPAGATTNSASGVTDIKKVVPTLQKMAEVGLPLLVHGEVTDPEVDIFDREKEYIERILKPLVALVPQVWELILICVGIFFAFLVHAVLYFACPLLCLPSHDH